MKVQQDTMRQQLTSKHERDMADASGKHRDELERLRKEISSLQQGHEQSNASLLQKHADEMEALRQAHERRIDELRDKLKDEQQEALKQQSSAAENRLQELEQKLRQVPYCKCRAVADMIFYLCCLETARSDSTASQFFTQYNPETH